MKKLKRERYLRRIRPWYDQTDIIKVVTGVRRSGKSVLMEQAFEELIERGVDRKRIAYLNLDSRKYHKIEKPDELEAAIDQILPADGEGRFLFIDEVQNVDGFEKLINSYRDDGVSVFITGSNSYLLSGELVTKLTGRYIEFEILPFSFSEMLEYKAVNGQTSDRDADFQDYLRMGGFPGRFSRDVPASQATYIRSVVSEIIEKDVKKRNRVKRIELFEKILQYLLAMPCATISSGSICRYLRNEHIETKEATVNRYIGLVLSSKLVSKCTRTDIVGNKALKTLYKTYVADPALHTMYPEPRSDIRIGMLIENVVYNELVSRGYSVTVGKFGKLEVDFVVKDWQGTAYVQVTYVMADDATVERELRPLLEMKEAGPKYLISMDPVTTDRHGVRHLHLVRDFLLKDDFRTSFRGARTVVTLFER